LDILSGFETLHICTGYQIGEEKFSRLPLGPANLAPMEAIYEELEGWEGDLTSIRSWDDLPHEAREYVSRIESLVNTPVKMISVGPERSQVIQR